MRFLSTECGNSTLYRYLITFLYLPLPRCTAHPQPSSPLASPPLYMFIEVTEIVRLHLVGELVRSSDKSLEENRQAYVCHPSKTATVPQALRRHFHTVRFARLASAPGLPPSPTLGSHAFASDPSPLLKYHFGPSCGLLSNTLPAWSALPRFQPCNFVISPAAVRTMCATFFAISPTPINKQIFGRSRCTSAGISRSY